MKKTKNKFVCIAQIVSTSQDRLWFLFRCCKVIKTCNISLLQIIFWKLWSHGLSGWPLNSSLALLAWAWLTSTHHISWFDSAVETTPTHDLTVTGQILWESSQRSNTAGGEREARRPNIAAWNIIPKQNTLQEIQHCKNTFFCALPKTVSVALNVFAWAGRFHLEGNLQNLHVKRACADKRNAALTAFQMGRRSLHVKI